MKFNNIRETLKNTLFVSPTPPNRRKEFLYLHDFIFPNKELFLNFLDEDNSERQVSLAKDILLSLFYDSHFAPPTRLLFNILDMDTNDLSTNFDTYIRRDHFVHLVHTYLLGIYIYFYHQAINEHVTNIFVRKRRKKNHASLPPIPSAEKDVMIAWRYFVLFHDLGYPLENYLTGERIKRGTPKTNETKTQKYLKGYEKIAKSIGKDMVLKGLSKILAINNLNRVSDEDIFCHIVGNMIDKSELSEVESKQKKSADDIIKNWANAKKLGGTYSYTTLKCMANVFSKEKMLAVLFDPLGFPIVLYIPGQDKHLVYKTNFGEKVQDKFILSPSFPFVDREKKYKKYSISYFYSDPQKETSEFIRYIFGENSVEDYNRVINYLSDLTESKAELITCETDFQRYCFDIYMTLYRIVGYYKYLEDDPSIDLASAHQLLKAIKRLDDDIPHLISKSIYKLLKQGLKQDKYFADALKGGENYKDTVKKIFVDVFTNFNGVTEEIAKDILSDITYKENLIKVIKKSREKIGSEFDKMPLASGLSIDYNQGIVKEKDELRKNSMYKIVSDRMKQMNIGEISTLLTNYVPNYKKDNARFFDHGICGGIVMMEILRIYEEILSHREGGNDYLSKIKKLAINSDINEWDAKKTYKILDILSESCYAIMIHNIYPEYLKDNPSYRTDLLTSPFAYFSILTDSLQPWDRNHSINQAYVNLPYSTSSKKFNIEIVKNKIRITEVSSGLSLNKRLSQLKVDLDKYLKHASNNIEIILGDIQ